ncbi:pyroglutamyl-peptidase I family protein [Tessaracoccus caeni]|uniref:pyroglutamyl-peptidase I family protein n=1 Tax=Tessaracoccus caeni TaxID=3031239 RepID=UPI0023DADB15|nr:hypothetical protein [Tessaracoccus caeni]MDF1489095.1 hypothetical protein [Tessaracoccus caeni]
MSIPTILLTGFEPFGGSATNASWDVALAVADAWDAQGEGARLVTALLPVTYAGAPEVVAGIVEREQPVAVLHLGLSGRVPKVEIERVALNLADARIPDNAGAQPLDESLDPDGPPALFATIPVKAALAACQEQGLPVELSLSAGTYVCNAVMYHSLSNVAVPQSGFVHLPEIGDGVGQLPLDTMARAVATILRACLAERVTASS